MCEACLEVTVQQMGNPVLGAQRRPRTVCERCLSRLRRAPDRWIGDLPVRSAYLHEGPAASVVHQLKYRGHVGVLGLFVPPMLDVMPSNAVALVPIPRVWSRRIRYGIDPAIELALALSRASGIPVEHALAAPLFGSPRAGRRRQQRHEIGFRARFAVRGAVLIDDVITTGATLLAAASALDRAAVIAGLTATGAA